MSNTPSTRVGSRGGGGHEVGVCFPVKAICENGDGGDGSGEGKHVCEHACLCEVEGGEDDGLDEGQA